MEKRSILPGGCTGWGSKRPESRLSPGQSVHCVIKEPKKNGKYKIVLHFSTVEGFLKSKQNYEVGDVVKATFLQIGRWGKIDCLDPLDFKRGI